MFDAIGILIVEDEKDIREMLALSLQSKGAIVFEASDTHEAWAKLKSEQVDLILLDWMLPNVSGLELLRRIRRNDSRKQIPIIMLTARGYDEDRVRGLDQGADDYVVKPFSVKELMSRINAVLRRTSPSHESGCISYQGLDLDTVSHQVTDNGNKVNLGPTEFKILRLLMENPNRVYSRGQMLDNVWNNVYVEERTVDVHIRRLRKALESSGHDDLIQTVRGIGYRFTPE